MTKNIYSVAQVNNYIKNMFAQDFMLHKINVSGEVYNCKYHTAAQHISNVENIIEPNMAHTVIIL